MNRPNPARQSRLGKRTHAVFRPNPRQPHHHATHLAPLTHGMQPLRDQDGHRVLWPSDRCLLLIQHRLRFNDFQLRSLGQISGGVLEE